MKTIDEIIAQALSELRRYDELNMLDEDDMARWAISALSEFGNLPTVEQEIFIPIQDYKGILPSSVYSMKYASRVGFKEATVKKGAPQKMLSQTVFKIREETPVEKKGYEWFFNDDGKYKYITETFYLHGGETEVEAKMDISYPLVLSKHRGKLDCDPRYLRNMKTLDRRENEISFMGQEVHANFEEGMIYMVVRQLPEDEEGNIYIADPGNDALNNYVLYNVIRKALARVWTSYGEDVQNKIMYYKAEEGKYKGNAMTALKAQGITGTEWMKKLQIKNQRRFLPLTNF